MPLNHYVTLGHSGLRVSPFCLGAMTFGEGWGFGTPPDESFTVLSRYLELGGNFIDTANIYTKGHSEAILGEYFATGPGKGRRDRVVIATKFMGNMYATDPNGGGANRKSVINACENSLRRLRTDHIDLYWAHFWDRFTPIEELMQTLDLLVKQGKVRYIGLSDHPAWVCAQAQYEARLRGWTPLVEQARSSTRCCKLHGRGRASCRWPVRKTRHHALESAARRRAERQVHAQQPARAGDRASGRRQQAPQRADLPVLVDAMQEIASARASRRYAALGAGSPVRRVDDRRRLHAQAARRQPRRARHRAARPEQTKRLDELSVPLPFPCEFLDVHRAGDPERATANGQPSQPWPLSPKTDAERW
ncbi:MAG: aldo/keto reductase [Phycisphaerales bacterium]